MFNINLATRKWDTLVGNYHFQVSILNLWVFSIAPSPSCPLSPLLVASPLVAAEVVVVARVEVVAMGPRRSPNPQKFMWATSLTFHYIAIPCMVVWYIYLHEWLMFMVFMLVNIPYMDDNWWFHRDSGSLYWVIIIPIQLGRMSSPI